MFVCTCADVCTWVCYAITGVQICDRITCTMRARKASLCMRFKRDLVARGCFRTKKKKKKKRRPTLSNGWHSIQFNSQVREAVQSPRNSANKMLQKKRTKVGTLHHPKIMLKK